MMRKFSLLIAGLFLIGTVSCMSSNQGKSSEDEVISLDDETGATDTTGDVAENTGGEDDLEKEIDGGEAKEKPVEELAEEKKAEAGQEPPPPVTEEKLVAEPDPVPPPAPSESVADVTNIKYLANQSGGTVVIETSSPVTYNVRGKTDMNQFVVEVTGARLPDHLKRPYLLKEFDAAFAAVNAYQNPGSTTARVVIQLKGKNYSDPVIQQEGNSLVIIPGTATVEAVKTEEKEAVKEAEVAQKNESINVAAANADEKALGARSLDEFLTGSNRFYGNKISVEVNDQDIREVLNFIAQESGLNLIMTEDVQGKITMKLRNIPWDQALITIMKAKKLGYVRQDSVIRISTLTSLQEENDAAKRILDSQKILAPIRVKVIPVSYAVVEDLVKQVQPFMTATRGQVVIDARTSSLILTDTEDVLDRVSRLVKELDIPPAQVMIEGKVVEAQDTFSQTLGLNWGASGQAVSIGKGKGVDGSDILLTPSLGIGNLPTNTTGNLQASVNVGIFEALGNLNATLALAETDSLVKILSSPRVVTINKEKANITQKGQVITVQTIRDAQGTETKNPIRSEFTLNLGVTPQVTAEGSVIMDVEVTREFPGAEDAKAGARPINSRSAKTKVLVADGQTAVIGGIYSSDNTTTESGVPWLRHIPVLGWLFKSRIRADTRNELLIFLTPKILNIKDQSVEG